MLVIGADYSFNPTNTDLHEQVMNITEGRGFDIVIECSGAASAVEPAFNFVARGGTLIIASAYKKDFKFPLDMAQVFSKEMTIKGVFLSPNLFDRSVRMLNRINFKETITAEFLLSQYQEAFKAHKSGKHIKIVFRID
ncbi:zinc-binding dehydrogenase [Paenibacillus kribbensis]|uniref:Alcohol dehydrogenase-like C-terminal domain-containing protein n=1 Tax=Paenibacillus kribbensis TaxID=172713 RepID=A0A222WNE9_9BACL|nr:zinc-binding dehydrogenase [Paenibacillus kribbensis]ASR47492.1 hypothetical protein B4V02_12825 [Paenibacillus kribbensis]